jgi:hypothetical protein
MDNLPHKMYLVLGDWSGDGHKQTDKILVSTNKTVKEIQEAYKASCKLTGVSFNNTGNDDFTGLKRDWQEAPKFQISVEYESYLNISPEAAKALASHGMKIPKYILNGKSDQPTEDFISLWFDFVKLSLPDLKYKEVKNDIPCINGHYDGNLNVSFGYGLYFGG